MKINNELITKIIGQLEEVYPDSINSTNDILPLHEDREEIRKHLLILGEKDRIVFRKGRGARGVKPLLFNIKLIED